ncbi:TrbI/VirB10 family protein [Enterovibrio calviensis]|uniref:TrbI/VirB10 family protein n=1 Tax=Enterovibrio calviensis TaxID=91359 RepID=UPI0037357FF1
MSNDSGRVPEIGSSDRGNLSIVGRERNKNVFIIGGFVLVGIIVIAVALGLVVKNINNKIAPVDETSGIIETTGDTASLQKGSSDVGDASFFFKQAKEKMDQAKRQKERDEAQRLEEELRLANAAKEVTTKPLKVAYIGTDGLERPDPKPMNRPVAKPRPKKDNVVTLEQRQLGGSVMVEVGGSQGGLSQGSGLLNGAGGGGYDTSFDGSAFATGSAAVRDPYSRDFLLLNGTTIPCVLETEIISDYSGFVKCRVTQDIYSTTGAILLVEKGSSVSGTQKVAMTQGKTRVFTSWASIETPEGVSVRIDSLGAGPRGASGTGAWIDNHYAQRFGGAVMLSLIDDALATIANNSGSSGSQLVVSNTTDNAGNMASEALKASIDIPPTAYVNIGTRLNILIVRDIDMSSVYRISN